MYANEPTLGQQPWVTSAQVDPEKPTQGPRAGKAEGPETHSVLPLS